METKYFLRMKGMESRYVEFRVDEYVFLLTRFEKVGHRAETEEGKFLYFIYVFHRKEFVDKNSPHNFMNFNKVYHTFESMYDELHFISEEYIIDFRKALKLLKLSQKLDPNYQR
ncbi:hypothetical protein KK120_18720 [Virgibacillus dakarensis]|nr:hypothetical protein [Virgibacillus dakarensis]